jgi:hypothetical protein
LRASIDPIFALFVHRDIRMHERVLKIMTYEELLEIALALGVWLEAILRRAEAHARTDEPAP